MGQPNAPLAGKDENRSREPFVPDESSDVVTGLEILAKDTFRVGLMTDLIRYEAQIAGIIVLLQVVCGECVRILRDVGRLQNSPLLTRIQAFVAEVESS